MALSPSDTGLSQADYEALQASFDAYTHQVVVERQNLAFDAFSTGGGSAGWQLDAIIQDGYLFRAIGSTIIRVNLTDGTYTDVSPSAPTGLTDGSTYSFAVNGSTLSVFAATFTGVALNTTTNYGSSWAGWSTIWSTANQAIYTGNVARNGTAAASSAYSSSTATYPASNAFDYRFLTQWITPIGTTTGTLRYDLGAGVTRVVTRYRVTSDGGGGGWSPKNWTFQGSNDAVAWTTLDTQTNITSWGSPETKTFSFTNVTAYRYYRLNVSANNGGTQLTVYEMSLHETSTDEAVILVAAASDTRVHFVFVDGTLKLYNLRVIEEIAGVWTLTSSAIQLTDRPYNLGVANISTTDFLLLETNVAGRVIDTLDDTELVSKRLMSGGLIVFHYKTDAVTWSTHFEIDLIDQLSAQDFMRYSHIENLNGELHVTAWIGSGTEAHPLTGFYDYSSKDGIHWSTRARLYFGAAQSTYGVVLLQSGEYAYAVEYGQVWRSLSTRYTGYTAAAIQEDITSLVESWSLSQNDLGQLTLLLDNADGYFDDHDFITTSNKLLVVLKFGGFIDGVQLLYQLGLYEVDKFSSGENVPEQMVQLSLRDYMGRMVDRVKASEFHSYDSYLIGSDNYLPKTNQNYGSLSHLYTVTGQIDSAVGGGILMQNNEAIGFSTFGEDIWNGDISCRFLVSGVTARAGLVFRSKSKDLFWVFLYDLDDDKVYLYRVNGNKNGSGTNVKGNNLYGSSALSWSATAAGTFHYLRVRFWYGTIDLYTSTDGVTWTLKSSVTPNMRNKQAPDSGFYSDEITDFDPCERGSVGVYGFGLQGTGFAQIGQFRMHDFRYPLTVEDAFRYYAGFARIHDQEYETLLYPGDDAWSSSLGVTVNTGMATGYYDQDVYDGALYG